MTQRIQIQPLQSNPGILPFKLGSAKIKIASHTFLHYIQLKPLYNQIKSITNQYNKLEELINNSTNIHRVPLYNAYKHLEYEVLVVNRKMQSLFPEKRTRRGLINPLGSLVKFISGNLDQEDAKEIHNSLLELESNQNKIVKKVNKQMSLTSNLMQNINETMTSVTRNQKLIETKIDDLRTGLNEFTFSYVHYLEIHEILNEIKLNLDSLLNFLSDTENAISFASLKTLHHSIVSPTELKEIVNTLYQIHSHSQILFDDNNYLKYYKIVETNVFYVQDKIVFSLDFPLIHSDTFDYYHLYSIPNQNQSIIIPPSTYLSISNNEYQYQEDECIDLMPNFLCMKNHLLPLQDNLECITSLLSNGPRIEKCQQVPVHVSEEIIEEINDAHYIGIFPRTKKLQAECTENDVALLQGTYLFVVPPNCAIKDARFTYKNEKGIISGHPVTLQEIKDLNIPTLEVQKLKLEKVSLDKLHEIQLQQLQEEPLEEFHIHSSYSIWSLVCVVMLILCIILYILIRRRGKILETIRKKKPVAAKRTQGEEYRLETQMVPPSSSF